MSSDDHNGDRMIVNNILKKALMMRPMSRTPVSDGHNGDRMIVTMILKKLWW